MPAEKVTEAALGLRHPHRIRAGATAASCTSSLSSIMATAIMNCRAIELLTAITGNTDGPGRPARLPRSWTCTYMGYFSDQPYPNRPCRTTPLKFHPEIMEKQLAAATRIRCSQWWAMLGERQHAFGRRASRASLIR